MKKLLKKIGKSLMVLKQRDERDIRQSLLLIDTSFILPNNFALILKGIKEKFKNAKISVLTFEDKKEFLRERFPDIEIVIADSKAKFKRVQPAIQLIKILGRHFDFIVLSSLDIIPIGFYLLFSKSTILLHNKWLEWYQLRLRTFADILKGRRSADRNLRKRNEGIKDFLKSLGRKFVILQNVPEENIKSHVLIVDNGYTAIDHILTAVRRTTEILVNPDIIILTFAQRQNYFREEFSGVRIVLMGQSLKDRLSALARQMYDMRRYRLSYIILTSLDILPSAFALEIPAVKVMLYNRWNQWWVLKFKNLKDYAKDLIKLIWTVPVGIYLVIVSGFILLRTFVRLRFINLKNFSYH